MRWVAAVSGPGQAHDCDVPFTAPPWRWHWSCPVCGDRWHRRPPWLARLFGG